MRFVRGALCFGILQGKRQIALARVITDRATFAYLADVFVDESARGLGLDRWLMEVIRAHPEWMMEIVRPDIYQTRAARGRRSSRRARRASG